MGDIPPIAWVIGVLGILYLAVRVWAGRAEERRRMARDERMARLLAERDQLPPPSAMPNSLSAVTSDRDAEKSPEKPVEKAETVKVRCRACKALNDERATTCEKCGAEL